MKKNQFYLMSAALLYFSLYAGAQTNKTVQATLDEVTLFLHGAEMVHSASATLNKGEQEVFITGLSSSIDRNSLKITAGEGTIISTYEYSTNYLVEKTLSPVSQKLQDSIDIFQKKVRQLKTEREINERLGLILNTGTEKTVSGSEKGLQFDELVKMMEYYKVKYRELAVAEETYSEKLKDYNDNIRRLEAQFNQEALKNNKTSGVLKLTVNSPLSANCRFSLSYYTTAASWAPYYDINVESSVRPVKFVMKAKARQTSGIDWNKIKLTLSTANPSYERNAPLLEAWFLNFWEAPKPIAYDGGQARSAQNMYSYNAASAQSAGKKSIAQIQKDMKDSDIDQIEMEAATPPPPTYIYVVNGELVDEATYNSLDASTVKSRTFFNSEQAKEQYGVNASGIWNVELKGSIDDYVKIGDNELNVSYAIDLPYSIPGNGKEQTIELKNIEANASYKYYCIPKLANETYLLAEITQPERLNLLSGKANITYEASYIGESLIDATSTRANLTLTLGTDKRISVKREKVQNFSSKKSLGTDVEQILTYKITVRNGQNRSIKMVVKDQYPISMQKDIKVELLKETTRPTFHIEEMGILSWEEEIPAGETKNYILSFSIRYPKNRTINL
ncbi:MAG: DUF4139 domain-containing protein [Tannerellaceae bacterium]|jgi:hypothetical protein|nr:DUF4139 domain-containing protein [Tannerellaceae bacterium]